MKSLLATLLTLLLILNAEALQADISSTNSAPPQTITAPAPSTIRPPDAPGPVFPLEDFMNIPEKQNDKFYTEFLNMLATLGLLIGVILIAAWFLKRFLNTRMEQINTVSSIKISERRALSPKTALYLLEVHDKTILIAESQNGVTLLSQINPENLPSDLSTNEPPKSFSKILEGNK